MAYRRLQGYLPQEQMATCLQAGAKAGPNDLMVFMVNLMVSKSKNQLPDFMALLQNCIELFFIVSLLVILKPAGAMGPPAPAGMMSAALLLRVARR